MTKNNNYKKHYLILSLYLLQHVCMCYDELTRKSLVVSQTYGKFGGQKL